MQKNIKKLYLVNFLTGFVFLYGVEKLFLRSIGITAAGIGIATAVCILVTLFLDVPAGILADRWSRKGVLAIAVSSLAIYSILEGSTHSLPLLIISYVIYAFYVVCTSGIFQALMYDILYEQEMAKSYSKINGKAYALFLTGAGLADVASGFIAHKFGYRAPFFVSVIPCVINLFVILSIAEPKFHKLAHKERVLAQVNQAIRSIFGMRLLLSLAVVSSLFTVVENFKTEYGQLYMLHYISSPQVLGVLWGMYSFTWAFGSFIAHRLQTRATLLMVLAVAPLIVMSFVDSKLGLALFMLQAIAAAALANIIETRVQDATPSGVRASILSILSWSGRLLSVPAVLLMGTLTTSHNVLWALRFATAIACFILLFWLATSQSHKQGYHFQTN